MIAFISKLWRPKGRHIFRFRVGRRWRYADPVTVHMLLAEHAEYLPRHLAEARAGDLEAIEICGRVACDAFGVSSLDDDPKRGLSIAERIKLLLAFDHYKMALRHKHDAFCRLSAIHGVDVATLDPERFCALYFTRIESEIRIANTQRMAINSARAELPLGWFLATKDTIDEASASHDKHIAAIAASRSQS